MVRNSVGTSYFGMVFYGFLRPILDSRILDSQKYGFMKLYFMQLIEVVFFNISYSGRE